MTCKFKQRLKELRQEKELQQKDLADILQVSKSAVSGWEVGRNQPNYETLMEIASYFEISVDYLLGLED